MAQSEPLILFHVEDTVAIISLNRPDKVNALSSEMWRELDAAFVRADETPDIRTIALVAEGRSFCAGADLSPGQDPTEILPWLHAHSKHHDRQFRMWDTSKTIIAGVQGHAIGRGLELALWCDIVVASEDAKLGQPEVREGWVLPSLVPWLTGPQQAKLFMLSGDLASAHEAQRLGLVARVVEAGAARSEAIKLAKRLSHLPPVTRRAVKQWVNSVYEQKGFRAHQAAGIGIAVATSAMTPREKGTEELERIRREQGFKASIKFRDAPFEL
jgi:enoyl-CoA hydratase